MPDTKKGLAETQAVNLCGLIKDAEKSLSKQVNKPPGQQRSVLDMHNPPDIEVIIGY